MSPALALADALVDFGRPFENAQSIRVPAAPRGAPEPLPSKTHSQADLDRAVAEAEAALEGRLAQRHEAELAALRAEHAADRDRREASFAEQLTALACDMRRIEADLLSTTSQTVASILAPLVTETLRVQAIEALAETVRAALRDRDALRLRITGPAALHARFAAALGEDAARFRFDPSDSLDLTVSLDNRLYAARLDEWAAALAEMKP